VRRCTASAFRGAVALFTGQAHNQRRKRSSGAPTSLRCDWFAGLSAPLLPNVSFDDSPVERRESWSSGETSTGALTTHAHRGARGPLGQGTGRPPPHPERDGGAAKPALNGSAEGSSWGAAPRRMLSGDPRQPGGGACSRCSIRTNSRAGSISSPSKLMPSHETARPELTSKTVQPLRSGRAS
jgi:hypothetical protein